MANLATVVLVYKTRKTDKEQSTILYNLNLLLCFAESASQAEEEWRTRTEKGLKPQDGYVVICKAAEFDNKTYVFTPSGKGSQYAFAFACIKKGRSEFKLAFSTLFIYAEGYDAAEKQARKFAESQCPPSQGWGDFQYTGDKWMNGGFAMEDSEG